MEVHITCTPDEFAQLSEMLPGITSVKTVEPRKPQKARGDNYPREFEQFWSQYPRKSAKALAFSAWNARIGEGVSHEEITKAAKNYSDYCVQERTEEKFIMQPSTFCGPNCRWKDYLRPRTTQDLPFSQTYRP